MSAPTARRPAVEGVPLPGVNTSADAFSSTPTAADVVAALTGTRYHLDERLDRGPRGRTLAADEAGSSPWQTWRAMDHRLARDVVIRVHVEGGSIARTRVLHALKLGRAPHRGLARVDDAIDAGDRAIIVSEYVPGPTLRQRLLDGPMPETAATTVVADVADSLAAAHNAGTSFGRVDVDRVVLSPTGAVVTALPSPEASPRDDVHALGVLLRTCLSGRISPRNAQSRGEWIPPTIDATLSAPGAPRRDDEDTDSPDTTTPASGPRPVMPHDLAMVAARAADPDSPRGIRSAATVATVLRQRGGHMGETDATGRMGAVERDVPVDYGLGTGPAPISAPQPVVPGEAGDPANGTDDEAYFYSRIPYAREPVGEEGVHIGSSNPNYFDEYDEEDPEEYDDEPRRRSRLMAILTPILALIAVIIVGAVIGIAVGVMDDSEKPPTRPSALTPLTTAAPSAKPSTAAQSQTGPIPVTAAQVYDPGGDGQGENVDEVPLAFDGDPSTAWPTLQYQRSAKLGNLKPGVGILFDLGKPVSAEQVQISTALPGAKIEIRAGSSPDGSLSSYAVVGSGTLDANSTIKLDAKQPARYYVVWITELVPTDGQFQASLGEVSFHG